MADVTTEDAVEQRTQAIVDALRDQSDRCGRWWLGSAANFIDKRFPPVEDKP